MRHRLLPWAAALALLGCAGGPAPQGDPPALEGGAPAWTSEVAARFEHGVGGCAVGDADPTRPGDEVVAVLTDGSVALVFREAGRWRTESIARLPGELIQVAIGDADPTRPGDEIVAVGVSEGGEDDGAPGLAVVIARQGEGWTVERAFEDEALLHAVCVADGGAYVAGYSRRAHFLRRGPTGWTAEGAVELPGPGRSAVAVPGGVAIACRDGSVARVTRGAGGWRAEVVERRAAGRARIGAAGEDLVVSDDDGTLSRVRLGAAAEPERQVVLRSADKLRGAVLADLEPEHPGLEVATAGYTGAVVVLRRRAHGWAPQVVINDPNRLHHLAAGTLPGSPDPSLVAASVGGRLWVAQRRRLAAPPAAETARLERVSTAVPWPRGLVEAEGELVALARGRHRSAGGPDSAVEDQAGTLFVVDPAVAEPVTPGAVAGEAVRRNARAWIRPSEPPFRLWRPGADPLEDTRTDRPYCTLAWDERSRNFFVCGYSGIDRPGAARFRKNATDSVLRYDLRAARWFPVEGHAPGVVPDRALGYAVSSATYPHHDPARNPPPHGWLNGPDGAAVAGRFLYAAAKDNSRVVQYDLAEVRRTPAAPAPSSRVVLGSEVAVRAGGQARTEAVLGHSAAAVWGGYLYVGFRTTSDVLRFPLAEDGDLARPVVGERVAQFAPYDPATRRSADLMDLAFDPRGELFVSTARSGRVWRVGRPDPARVFTPDGRAPYVDLRAATGHAKARAGNIAFDGQGRLYVCSGTNDLGPESPVAGTIYRAAAP